MIIYTNRNKFLLLYIIHFLIIYNNRDKTLLLYTTLFPISQTANHTAENLLSMLDTEKLKLLSLINGTIVSLIVLIKGTEEKVVDATTNQEAVVTVPRLKVLDLRQFDATLADEFILRLNGGVKA